jgi:mycothiol synthase
MLDIFSPPAIPMHIWRPLHPTDGQAMRHFLADCAHLDGQTEPASPRRVANPEKDTLAAVDNQGRIAAYAWLRLQNAAHESRVFIDGRVHPDHRGKGLGRYLLTWSERRATEMLARVNRPESEKVLRCDFYDRDTDALRLYTDQGYTFRFAELEMERHLTALPSRRTDVIYTRWDHTGATTFYRTYEAAFRTRPGFPGWPQATWVANLTQSKRFRADLSLVLMLHSGKPRAFAISREDKNNWLEVAQLGVRDDARRRGYGTALLTEIMHRAAARGFAGVRLCVNQNNPEAIALYRKLNFDVVRTYHSYQKGLSAVAR